MSNVFYAVFTSHNSVESAERETRTRAPAESYEFLHHEGPYDTGQAPLKETRATAGILRMALVGGLVGIGGGALAQWADLPSLGAFPIVQFAAVMGLAVGAFVGVFVGPSLPDPAIARLARGLGGGRVLVTVTAPSPEKREEAEEIFRRHGAELGEHVTM